MKTRKLIATSLFIALTGLFISCSNDDELSCTPDYTGALTEQETEFAGTWTLTAIEANTALDLTDDNEDNPTNDIFIQQTSCQNDFVYTYKTDRSYTYEVGENVANCTTPTNGNGTWKLEGTALSTNASCYESVQNITLNANGTAYTVKNNATATDVNGQTSQIIITYTFTKNAADIEPAN